MKSLVQQSKRLLRLQTPLNLHWRTYGTPKRAEESAVKMLVVNVEEARRFIIDCFLTFRVPKEHAISMADLLIAADYRGIYGEGICRLERFVNQLSDNSLKPLTEPRILQETAATALVSGRNGLGVVVGNFCMDLAIQKALDCGIGWVCTRMSNDICMASWYALRAMQNGLIGIAMSNSYPTMVPTNAYNSMLGANCIAFGAMGRNDHYILDMATSMKSFSTIDYYHNLEAALPQSNWALDSNMEPTNKSSIALRAERLLPAGGHKGYGLGAMIDILCGVLSDANYLTKIPRWRMDHKSSPTNLGQVFIAIDPEYFEPGFKERLQDFNARVRESKPARANTPIIVPGEFEAANMQRVDKVGGIQYSPILIQRCQSLARWLAVRPLGFVTTSRV